MSKTMLQENKSSSIIQKKIRNRKDEEEVTTKSFTLESRKMVERTQTGPVQVGIPWGHNSFS